MKSKTVSELPDTGLLSAVFLFMGEKSVHWVERTLPVWFRRVFMMNVFGSGSGSRGSVRRTTNFTTIVMLSGTPYGRERRESQRR
jgi:hypothetical protein